MSGALVDQAMLWLGASLVHEGICFHIPSIWLHKGWLGRSTDAAPQRQGQGTTKRHPSLLTTPVCPLALCICRSKDMDLCPQAWEHLPAAAETLVDRLADVAKQTLDARLQATVIGALKAAGQALPSESGTTYLFSNQTRRAGTLL